MSEKDCRSNKNQKLWPLYTAKTFACVQVFQNICDSTTLIQSKYISFDQYSLDLQLKISGGMHTVEHALETCKKMCSHLPCCIFRTLKCAKRKNLFAWDAWGSTFQPDIKRGFCRNKLRPQSNKYRQLSLPQSRRLLVIPRRIQLAQNLHVFWQYA